MLKQMMTAAAATAGIALATDATATTYYDFRTDGASGTAETLDYGLFSVSSDASVLGVDRPSKVSYGGHGLGVAGFLDLYDASQVNGFSAGTSEGLTVTFDRAVRLSNFTLARLEFGDEYAYSINGGALTESTLAFNEVDASNVAILSTFAKGPCPTASSA